ncbi:MAG TPA: SAM-dependent methyltransferase [Kofleriaceae bacterium]|nr:SAM-dependent methyltransferase [Kofleriaceae bacterium]
MRDETPSRTAAFVAAVRQLGQLLPPDARLVEDPYGAAFTSATVGRALERNADQLRLLAAMPGMKNWILYMQVRTRVIDDAVREFVEAGGRQVVVLGAGYDTRALRLPELVDADVYEIDHPATQGHKRRTLERIGAQSPAHYVTWDFEARPMEDLPDELAGAGLDLGAPVFTIWEGVTMYLTEPAIDASLRAIRQWSAAGSRLAMTYVIRSRLERPSLISRAMQMVVSSVGEPWKWGWDPDELPEYLAARDFTLLRDVPMRDAARELLPPQMAIHVPHRDRRIAVAAGAESIALAK